jgi:hypothetical protein
VPQKISHQTENEIKSFDILVVVGFEGPVVCDDFFCPSTGRFTAESGQKGALPTAQHYQVRQLT